MLRFVDGMTLRLALAFRIERKHERLSWRFLLAMRVFFAPSNFPFLMHERLKECPTYPTLYLCALHVQCLDTNARA